MGVWQTAGWRHKQPQYRCELFRETFVSPMPTLDATIGRCNGAFGGRNFSHTNFRNMSVGISCFGRGVFQRDVCAFCFSITNVFWQLLCWTQRFAIDGRSVTPRDATVQILRCHLTGKLCPTNIPNAQRARRIAFLFFQFV